MIDPAQARSFLRAGRIAVIGASDDEGNFGRVVCRALREHDREVVAVHPTAAGSAGAPGYPSLDAVPGPVDTAIVMVPADRAAAVVTECVALGVGRIWLFKGVGKGAVSQEALRTARDAGCEVVAGACPLMFLEPVRGVHRFHRGIRRMRRAVKADVGSADAPAGPRS